jgi:Holliday junction resolvase RusA-like endonuclease
MTTLTVTVLGVPAAQGSMRSVGPGRLIHSNDAKLRPWRDTVAWHIREDMQTAGHHAPFEGPVAVRATFTLPRPKSAVKARWAPDRKPDLDKLARALLDSLTMGGAVADDAQVIDLAVSKVYAIPPNLPGVTFTVAPAERGEVTAA